MALVEINPDSVVNDLIQGLAQRGICYQSATVNQTVRQAIAVVFKCDAVVTDPRRVADSDAGNPFLRKALAVDVRLGSYDFILITLHLKAARGLIEHETRDMQTKAISGSV